MIFIIGVFMKYDYLIVGSGLFGSVFAYEMTKRGKKCLVIEKRDHIGENVYTEEEYGNTLWARTLKYRIELEPSLRQYADVLDNKDATRILELAQALLANPYKRLLETMHEIIGQPTEQQGY
jgi:choline dehydrogenase-like flavoprotein